MSLMHILLNIIDADMKSEIGSSRGGLRPYTLGFHARFGADAKLIQHGPLGVACHQRHPISTIPVARITAHAMVPGFRLFTTVSVSLVSDSLKVKKCLLNKTVCGQGRGCPRVSGNLD
jgi:hypothetical protein